MLCRCRYLRAPHLESFLLIALPSTPTRLAFRAVSASPTFSQSFTGSSASHDEKALGGWDGEVLNVNGLLGSIRSPLAFKPLPFDTLNPLLRNEEEYLGPESEQKLLPPVALHTKDPLLPCPCSNPEPPNTSEDVEGAGGPNVADPGAPSDKRWLPWHQYVKQLKVEKFRRQVTKASEFLDPVHAIQQWDHIRTWDRVQIANMSVLRWTLLTKAGCLLSDPSVLYHLPAELIDAHEGSPRAQYSMVVRVLGSFRSLHGRKFDEHPVFYPLLRPWGPDPDPVSELDPLFHKNLDRLSIDLFNEYFQDKSSVIVKLHPNVIFHLIVVAAYQHPEALNSGGLLNAFFAAARLGGSKLLLAFPSRFPESFDSAPTGHLWVLFRLVQVYINSGSRQEAFRLFQRLVREKMITPSAISQVKINQEDPRTAVLFAITKTCLDYEWNTGALELMILAAEYDPTVFDEQMRSLVNETLYELLNQAASMSPAQKFSVRKPSAVQQKSTQQALDGLKFILERIMALVVALRGNHQAFEIEDKVIQNFYAVARQLDSHYIAEVLFSIGRLHTTPPIPPPSILVSPSFAISGGPSPRTLLPVEPSHLAYKSPHPQSERSPEPLVTATTQYPVPRGPSLLWLFEAMLKKSKNVHLCRSLAKEVVESNIDIPVYDRGHFTRLVANAGFAQAAKDLWKRYSEDESQGVIGHAGAMMRLVRLFYHLGNDLEAKEAMADEGSLEAVRSPSKSSLDPDDPFDDDDAFEMGAIDGEDAKVLFDADAAKGFAKEVVERFRACKEPIRAMSQHDLNALARAYFVMDRLEEGFTLFELVKATHFPDMYDVNVGLSGVAMYDVELASRMVDRMHERGLAPNTVTWSTLIHLAYLKGDTGLVINLLKRAQRWSPEFSSRTIDSLIRASLSDVPPESQVPSHSIALGSKRGVGSLQLTLGGEGGAEQMRQNLDVAWHLIGTFDTQTFVGVWSLAKFCLDRALWLGDAELAFRFWNKHIRFKTQWSDAEQVKCRKKLYELVATAKWEQKLEVPQAAKMLRQISRPTYGHVLH